MGSRTRTDPGSKAGWTQETMLLVLRRENAMLDREPVPFLLQLRDGSAELVVAVLRLVELLLIERKRHFGDFSS